MICAVQIMVDGWVAWKRTVKSMQIAETDQSTCLRILIKGFLKKNAPTRPEDSIKRIAPTDQTARVHTLPQFSLKYRTGWDGLKADELPSICLRRHLS